MLLPAAAQAGNLRAGVGRADITPPTGYYMMGWVRSDAKVTGQHTRLFARAIVLEKDGKKFALVSEDLNGVPGGMVEQAANMLKDRGFSEQNVLVSASHTHAAPTGFYNFGTYNTVFPSTGTLTSFNTAVDPQLYAFMVRQLAEAIRRADDNLGPASAAWGETHLHGLTRNRSIEAHLADHGIIEEPGTGSDAQDPLGADHAIDPEVSVLRVDRRLGKKSMPIGMWSTFSNHGTVNKYTFHYYNADHHGAATRLVESAIRRKGKVPAKQDVVNAYGNTDEGDVSSGLDNGGPAYADYVGRVETQAFLKAWRSAGRRLDKSPALAARWTRICFCGQATADGSVDDKAVIGQPLITGSEEGRGPLYDITHDSYEGRHMPVGAGPQGDKQQLVTDVQGSTPRAVPLTAFQLGPHVLVSIPGEMTAEMGRRVRSAVFAVAKPGGITGVTISGLANEYLSYFTTPEEYDRQHYEGGSTLYGRVSSNLLEFSLVDLTKALVEGRDAPTAYPYDPTQGLTPDAAPFDPGAASSKITAQPGATRRLQRAHIEWTGGPRGEDRPLDRAFVSVQRKVKRKWTTVDTDLGLDILWQVSPDNLYSADWEVPLGEPEGVYRIRVTANRYRLDSRAFRVGPSIALALDAATGGARLTYPGAVYEKDLTYRPDAPHAGRLTATVDGKRRVIKFKRGAAIALPAGHVVIARGAARD
ncbi:MAG: neutral ceramidase, partial [Thermoleophilaceae bacterium]|nr:neutral ceramidase [Thermoleophilaceae bacterium]